MSAPILTLTLPAAVYDRLAERARERQRGVDEEAALVLGAAIGVDDGLPIDLAATIDTLATLDDGTLWHISRSQPTVEDGILLDALVDKRRREKLTDTEEQLLTDLIDRHDRVMVLRAEAIALLRARGHDVQAQLDRA